MMRVVLTVAFIVGGVLATPGKANADPDQWLLFNVAPSDLERRVQERQNRLRPTEQDQQISDSIEHRFGSMGLEIRNEGGRIKPDMFVEKGRWRFKSKLKGSNLDVDGFMMRAILHFSTGELYSDLRVRRSLAEKRQAIPYR
ncbi:MAG: hypothetical protein ACFB6S_01095 [Geminicoccaceae bacterium]